MENAIIQSETRAIEICENSEICRPGAFRFHLDKSGYLRVTCLDSSAIRKTHRCLKNRSAMRARHWYYSEEFLEVRQPENHHICAIGVVTSLITRTKGLIRLKLTVCSSLSSSTPAPLYTVIGSERHSRQPISWPLNFNPKSVGMKNETYGWIVGGGLYLRTNVLSLKVSTRLFPLKLGLLPESP